MKLLITKYIVLPFIFLATICSVHAQPNYTVGINVVVVPPVSTYINQALTLSGSGIHVMLRNTLRTQNTFILVGSIERLSPSPFSMTIQNPQKLGRITLGAMEVRPLDNSLLSKAFDNFDLGNLLLRDIAINDIKEGFNFKFPEGTYRICFYAVDPNNNPVSDRNTGCAFLNICKIGAPQFIQPANNVSINTQFTVVRPASPVVFTWRPPQAACGGVPLSSLMYDFEIKEVQDNQTVTDALNNPYVFRKNALLSTTFLLDTNLYKNVLQTGKRYVIRVKAAIAANSPFVVENNGYSRVEAFQYGENNSTALDNAQRLPPDYYYIPFLKRKSDFWDSVMTAYENKSRRDTLVPIKEYIPLILARNAIVYSLDAIELFVGLNPDLAEKTTVKLSIVPKLPVFAKVSEKARAGFAQEYTANLKPDIAEERKFGKYLDSLTLLYGGRKIDTYKMFDTLLNHLGSFSPQVSTTNRVSVTMINDLLSQLLKLSGSNVSGMNEDQKAQFTGIISNLEELITQPRTSAYLSRYQSASVAYNDIKYFVQNESATGYPETPEQTSEPADQLLPFDVVVYHYSKEQPNAPVLNTPDLMDAYKVYYVLTGLYNRQNPEINAKSTIAPASTAQVMLPRTKFKFWAQNIYNHKFTKAEDQDLMDAFLHNQKKGSGQTKYAIVLKVE